MATIERMTASEAIRLIGRTFRNAGGEELELHPVIGGATAAIYNGPKLGGRWFMRPQQFFDAMDNIMPLWRRTIWRSENAVEITAGDTRLHWAKNRRCSAQLPLRNGKYLRLLGPSFTALELPSLGVPSLEEWQKLPLAEPESGVIGGRIRWACPECTRCFTSSSNTLRHLKNGSCPTMRLRAGWRLGLSYDRYLDQEVDVTEDDRSRVPREA